MPVSGLYHDRHPDLELDGPRARVPENRLKNRRNVLGFLLNDFATWKEDGCKGLQL
jgi:hypothetical protein